MYADLLLDTFTVAERQGLVRWTRFLARHGMYVAIESDSSFKHLNPSIRTLDRGMGISKPAQIG